jgi:hypothetical protein
MPMSYAETRLRQAASWLSGPDRSAQRWVARLPGRRADCWDRPLSGHDIPPTALRERPCSTCVVDFWHPTGRFALSAQAEDWCGEIAASGLDRRLAPPAQCPAIQGIRHPVPRPSVAQLFLHRRRGRYLAVIAQDRSRCGSTGQPSTAKCGPTPDRREPMQGGQSRATPDPPRSGSHHVDVGIGRRLGGDWNG